MHIAKNDFVKNVKNYMINQLKKEKKTKLYFIINTKIEIELIIFFILQYKHILVYIITNNAYAFNTSYRTL